MIKLHSHKQEDELGSIFPPLKHISVLQYSRLVTINGFVVVVVNIFVVVVLSVVLAIIFVVTGHLPHKTGQ